jgi:hypothetical protein
LSEAVRSLRSLYVFQRRCREEDLTGRPSFIGANAIPSWDGGTDRNGRTFKPVWPTLAAQLASAGVEPIVFVEARFADRTARIPEPNQLHGHLAAELVADYEQSGPRDAFREWESAKSAFVLAVSRTRQLIGLETTPAARAVLTDTRSEFTPLFRYCLAVRGGAHDIAAGLADAAVRQLALGYFRYSAGWGDDIPGEIDEEAQQVLATLCRGGEVEE